ncbi:hypothetical protein CRENBAI_019815, partial [Crenichthys baileyi]
PFTKPQPHRLAVAKLSPPLHSLYAFSLKRMLAKTVKLYEDAEANLTVGEPLMLSLPSSHRGVADRMFLDGPAARLSTYFPGKSLPPANSPHIRHYIQNLKCDNQKLTQLSRTPNAKTPASGSSCQGYIKAVCPVFVSFHHATMANNSDVLYPLSITTQAEDKRGPRCFNMRFHRSVVVPVPSQLTNAATPTIAA